MAAAALSQATSVGATDAQSLRFRVLPVSGDPMAAGGAAGALTLLVPSESWIDDTNPTVLIVNRTTLPVILKTQDWDPFIKLEYEASPGRWARAQTHHYSGCGNSYFNSDSILPDSFVRLPVYRPRSGRRAKVRFKLHGQDFELQSEPFWGAIDDAQVAIAQSDRMSIVEAALSRAVDIAWGHFAFDRKSTYDPIFSMSTDLNPRLTAIYRIAELAKTDRLARDQLARLASELPEQVVEGGTCLAILARSLVEDLLKE